ncbi:anthranilate synthase component I [Shouchella clausii]|uniref:anthranilate synthase component I n=1 Tax=Shouchella clausii TaxID=79880 RepID=UPI000797B6A0|nr:anthranilate synthase component I [Shouchella clausii]KKI85741.1 anthranilate synthase component I [Shouchella clausii]PAD48657.1 anthranilate synthase component I [Shouchella clausii]
MKKTPFASFQQAYNRYGTCFYSETVFADGLTPIQMFQALQEEATYLLESNDVQSEWSNYSFIGLSPIYECVEENGSYKTIHLQTGNVVASAVSFEACYQKTVSHIDPQPSEMEIPFQGGAVGYVSYDAVEEIEPVIKRSDQRSCPYYHFIFCEQLLSFHEQTKQLTLIQLVKSGLQPAEQAFAEAQAKIRTLIGKLESAKAPVLPHMVTKKQLPIEVRSNYSKQGFINDVNRIKAYIQAGDIFQAVLSQRLEMTVSVGGLDLYRVLRYVNPSPYLYYIKIGKKEIIGSSPEKLVQVRGDHVEIHPIAGTRKRGQTAAEDEALARELLADDKERAEHHMLVDLARNDVGKVSVYGSVEVPSLLEIGKFSHVMHLVSKVTGKLKPEATPYDALKAAFPAGTLSGAPKIRAMQILNELEPTRRGIYGGAICYMDFNGNIDSCIAIRTIVLEGNCATIQAGAGIVADSDPEKEYEETLNKAKALIHAIEQTEALFAKAVRLS